MTPTDTDSTATATATAIPKGANAPATATDVVDTSSRRSIVFALDGSSSSTHALEWGLKNLVHPQSDHIVLLSVGLLMPDWQDMLEASLDVVTGGDELGTDKLAMKQAAQQSMGIVQDAEKIVQEFFESDKALAAAVGGKGREHTSYELAALIGDDVRSEIVDFCTNNKVDMLIMGSRGMGMIKRALIGSVSDYCVHNVTCPIMIIREQQQPQPPVTTLY